MKLIRIASGESRDEWAKFTGAIGPGPTPELMLAKQEAGDWVALGTAGGARVVIKHRRLHGLFDVARTWFGLGRLARQWRGAATLTRLGLVTPRPLALGVSRTAEVLVMEHAGGESLLKLMAGQTTRPHAVRDEHRIAERLGEAIARLTALGWFNRDFKPSNILIADPIEDPVVVQIDTVGIRRTQSRTGLYRPRGGRRGAPRRMLASLYMEPLGCGFPPRRALLMRGLTAYTNSALVGITPDLIRAARHSIWRLLDEEIARHGDPTPRTPPI
ncbi:MAG: hypothetical protein H7Y88_11685 [Phycisphaerales bacterium]|nr:hypothetical protein [Phycisphaerales bacterium]